MLAKRGLIIPPTILRIALAGGSVKREWADLVFDSDRLLANLNFSDQRSNNLSPGGPVCIFKSVADSRTERLQLINRCSHVLGFRLSIDGSFGLELEFRKPFIRGTDSGLEFLSIQKSFLVGIDQTRYPSTDTADQPCELFRWPSCFLSNAA